MGRKAASRESPGRMLYAAKIDDRHLSEGTALFEMAAFYMWLDFTLTSIKGDHINNAPWDSFSISAHKV